jgi:hypothetical protein
MRKLLAGACAFVVLVFVYKAVEFLAALALVGFAIEGKDLAQDLADGIAILSLLVAVVLAARTYRHFAASKSGDQKTL